MEKIIHGVNCNCAHKGMCEALEAAAERTAQADAYLREQERGEECPNCISPWKCNGPHIGRQPDFYTADHMDEAPAASAPADANAAPMDDMNDIVLRELAKEEAPADAPVAWYRNGPRGFVFSADLELESVWPRRSEGWIPLYATPPAPASGAVMNTDDMNDIVLRGLASGELNGDSGHDPMEPMGVAVSDEDVRIACDAFDASPAARSPYYGADAMRAALESFASRHASKGDNHE
jgi:hypothetical protein